MTPGAWLLFILLCLACGAASVRVLWLALLDWRIDREQRENEE